MKRAFLSILMSLCICQIVLAQSFEDKRRIEEEKRKDLRPSESYLSEIQDVSPPVVEFDQNTYFTALLSKEVATMSDAYRTLAILMGVADQYGDHESQYYFLVKKKIVTKRVTVKPDYETPLRKGATAYMFAKAMDIKGGMTLRLFGFSQRYALKELVHQEIMIPGIVHDYVSGQELILTLTQAADYMADSQADLQQ